MQNPTIKLLLLSSILILFIIFGCKNPNQYDKFIIPKLNLNPILNLSVTVDSTNSNDSILNLTALVSNPGPFTATFLSMTCSYEDFFITDTNSVAVWKENMCFSNVAVCITLLPNTIKVFKLSVVNSKKDKNLFEIPFKIGMYYIPVPKSQDNLYTLLDHKAKADIIWSKSVYSKSSP